MGSLAFLSDTLRGVSSHNASQTVVHKLFLQPASLPLAIMASQALFFAVQSVAVRRQLRLMKSPSWIPPEAVEGEPKNAPIHASRVRQMLVATFIGYGASFGLTVLQVSAGWDTAWRVAVEVGKWSARKFGLTRPYLVANPVFVLLDLALTNIVQNLGTTLYLAYSSPDIFPETANLSYLGRLKARLSRSWNASTFKMWFLKAFGGFFLPTLSMTPGIIVASQVQHDFEKGLYNSTSKAVTHLAGAGLLTVTLAGVIGASLPFLFFTDEDFAERGKPLPTKPTRRKIEHCPLEGLESRGIQLKAKDGNLSYDRSSMEALVAEVMKEVGYQETVKIIIGLDTDQEFAETWLFFMPRLDRNGALFLSQRQLEIFEPCELKTLIARALLPGLKQPFDLKTIAINFAVAPIPLLVPFGLYWLVRKIPYIFDGMIPTWATYGNFVPLVIFSAAMYALVPWTSYSQKIAANAIAKQLYRDDQRIVHISPEYAKGWAGVLRKHRRLYPLYNEPESFIWDYGSLDPFFETWYASFGTRSEGPGLAQRLQKLPQ
ncbi:hypothetical protein NliqN6_6080 [Naganishia liquefaciens]|uniref:Uncharacterized protein n=1 Tax=Naganishia liquefaciens TaxID=104408 RepID=A0A8H3YHT4_9TREE|nr:hypothetical protein NliqN6_6080 [Naganishia liquefaciens]